MKKIIFILAAALFTTLAYSEQSKETKTANTNRTIQGIVIDAKTGEALVGVAIQLNNKTLYTGFDGEFTLDSQNLEGEQNITATYVSYKPTKINIEGYTLKKLTISLEVE